MHFYIFKYPGVNTHSSVSQQKSKNMKLNYDNPKYFITVGQGLSKSEGLDIYSGVKNWQRKNPILDNLEQNK